MARRVARAVPRDGGARAAAVHRAGGPLPAARGEHGSRRSRPEARVRGPARAADEPRGGDALAGAARAHPNPNPSPNPNPNPNPNPSPNPGPSPNPSPSPSPNPSPNPNPNQVQREVEGVGAALAALAVRQGEGDGLVAELEGQVY